MLERCLSLAVHLDSRGQSYWEICFAVEIRPDSRGMWSRPIKGLCMCIQSICWASTFSALTGAGGTGKGPSGGRGTSQGHQFSSQCCWMDILLFSWVLLWAGWWGLGGSKEHHRPSTLDKEQRRHDEETLLSPPTTSLVILPPFSLSFVSSPLLLSSRSLSDSLSPGCDGEEGQPSKRLWWEISNSSNTEGGEGRKGKTRGPIKSV